MVTSIGNNSSLLTSDYLFRQEFDQYAAKINFILSFVQSFVSLSGLIGNSLALIVINRKSLRNTSSAVFITYMALFDSAVLLLHPANLILPRRNLYIHCSLIYLTDLFTFCANWVLVIITLERCVAVSSPFLAKRFCTVHSARNSIYILLTTATIFFSVTFPLFHHANKLSHRKKCRIRPHLALIHRIYKPILFYAIPDILLLSNLFTVYSLIKRRRDQQRRSSNNTKDEQLEMRVNDVHSNRKQRQLTIMLVTVNLAFYLFTTPAMIRYIIEYYPPKHREITQFKRSFLFSQISVLLLQLNNATNFIFYCFAAQRFRQATIQTFNEYSAQFKIFFHRYILRDKHYRLPQNYQLGNMANPTTANRTSYPEQYKQSRNRADTL